MVLFQSEVVPYLPCQQGMSRIRAQRRFDVPLHAQLNHSLRRYLTDIAHVDIYWFIGSRLDQAPAVLPCVTEPIHGSSTVPWRYHFNTGVENAAMPPASIC